MWPRKRTTVPILRLAVGGGEISAAPDLCHSLYSGLILFGSNLRMFLADDEIISFHNMSSSGTLWDTDIES